MTGREYQKKPCLMSLSVFIGQMKLTPEAWEVPALAFQLQKLFALLWMLKYLLIMQNLTEQYSKSDLIISKTKKTVK
jgi:hypothetical protein